MISSDRFTPIRKAAVLALCKSGVKHAREIEHEIYLQCFHHKTPPIHRQSATTTHQEMIDMVALTAPSTQQHVTSLPKSILIGKKKKNIKHGNRSLIKLPVTVTSKRLSHQLYDTTNSDITGGTGGVKSSIYMYSPMDQYIYPFRSKYRHLIHNALISPEILRPQSIDEIEYWVAQLYWNISVSFFNAKLESDRREQYIRGVDQEYRKPNSFLYKCPRCGGTGSRISTSQTASADESETIYARCCSCDNKWKPPR